MQREKKIDPSQRFVAIIPMSVVENFRRAVFNKHKTLHGPVFEEVARALMFHTQRLYLESGNEKEAASFTLVSIEQPKEDDPGFVTFAGVFDGKSAEDKEEGE